MGKQNGKGREDNNLFTANYSLLALLYYFIMNRLLFCGQLLFTILDMLKAANRKYSDILFRKDKKIKKRKKKQNMGQGIKNRHLNFTP